jgi:hypothetical protein
MLFMPVYGKSKRERRNVPENILYGNRIGFLMFCFDLMFYESLLFTCMITIKTNESDFSTHSDCKEKDTTSLYSYRVHCPIP